MNKLLATTLVVAVIGFFVFDGDKKFAALVGGDSPSATNDIDLSPAKTKTTSSTSKKKKKAEVPPIDVDAPRRMIIGLDLSASNPLVDDAAYAQKVGRRLNDTVSELAWRSDFKLRTFGAYGSSSNPIAFDATISTKMRPEVVGRDINIFVSNIPNLVRQGQLDSQPYTNILAFLEELAIELNCKEMPTQVILVTDGIEDSEYVRLKYKDAKLPRRSKIFKGCYELQILGVGRSMKSPSETQRIREEWKKWAKSAGFLTFKAVNDW